MFRWYPELLLFGDEEAGLRALQSCGVPAVGIVFKYMIVVAGAVFLHDLAIAPVFGLPNYVTIFVAVTLFTGYYQFSSIRRIRRALRRELLKRGTPVCLYCGYDTRNLPENRCPECGTPFEPVEPREQDGSAD